MVNPSDADEDEVKAAQEVAEEKAGEEDENDFEEEVTENAGSEEEKTEE